MVCSVNNNCSKCLWSVLYSVKFLLNQNLAYVILLLTG